MGDGHAEDDVVRSVRVGDHVDLFVSGIVVIPQLHRVFLAGGQHGIVISARLPVKIP